MKDFIKKIGSLVQPIVSEKGDLNFFALTLRDDAIVWDLLVAAEWIEQDRRRSLDYLVEKVQGILTKKELLDISGIILLPNESVTGSPTIISESGWEETDFDIYGVTVKKVYIFVAPAYDFQISSALSK